MKLKAGISYNLDLLCMMNILSADEFYTERHKDAFDEWYPKISDAAKQSLIALTVKIGHTMLSPLLTLYVSALPHFESRNMLEMLDSIDEMEHGFASTPYTFDRNKYQDYLHAVKPVIVEIEKLGFRGYWERNQLPKIQAKVAEIEAQLAEYKMDEVLYAFADRDMSDCTIYLCAFTDPLGIKICGNNVITDVRYNMDIILSNTTHEIFHPPYDTEMVLDHIQTLFEMPWVQEVYNKLPDNFSYKSMKGFVEECIVEAIGIYLANKLGANIEPYKYFEGHDDGTHVISPRFYKYLCEVEKKREQSMEDYFIDFVHSLDNPV